MLTSRSGRESSRSAADFLRRLLATGAIGLVVSLSGCAIGSSQPPTLAPSSPSIDSTPVATTPATPSPTAAASEGRSFDLASVGTDTESPVTFSNLMDIASMKVGVYRLKAGATDPQDSHAQDEVYIVVHGGAVLHTPDHDTPVSDGSIVFVRGSVSHAFEQVESQLTAVVLFAKAAGGPDEPPVLTTDATSLAENPSPTTNLWRRFIKVPSVTGGAYLLPLQRGGDRSQTHQTDELNVVISGTGVLHVGADDVSYGPGSLIFVPAHVGHAFHDLSSDSEVLIFWPANP